MGKKRDLTTWTSQHKRVNVTLIFLTSTRDATEIGPRDKKDLHKTWLTECFLIDKIQTYMMCYVAIGQEVYLQEQSF